MDNRDIFHFDFVDRKKQEDIINIFLSDSSNENFLWMDGESGIGKSYFIENRINSHIDNFLHINICLSSGTDNINCINEIVKSLQSKLKFDFINFLLSNYKALLDVGKNTTIELLKNKNRCFELFFEVLFDSNIVFKSKNDNIISSEKVLHTYINNILNENKILVILDNFSNCDQKSLAILQSIFPNYVGNSNFKCIFVTNSFVLAEKEYIQIFLTETLPIQRLIFEELKKTNYFYSILDNIFEMDSEIRKSVQGIHHICKGNPETLKSLIRKIYLNSGIEIPTTGNSKARIDYKILNKYLIEESFDIDNNDLSEEERFVIHIVLGFGSPVLLDILQSCILYIHKKLFNSSLWTISVVNNVLNSLQRKNILLYDQKIKFVHDRIHFGLSLLLEKDLNKPLISSYFYEFLQDNKTTDIDIDYLLAYHSYVAQRINWSDENYTYGMKKVKEKKYYDAFSIFNRLLVKHVDLNFSKTITICKVLYETGNYDDAKSLLLHKEFSLKNKQDLFAYYCLWGKIENILLNKEIAIQKYDEALKYALNREEEIQILNLKHLALLETPEGKEKARKIFNDIALHITDEEKKMMSVCNLLRNCNQFYTGDEAEKFFKLAKKIAGTHGRFIDVAYVDNNYGLELFRTGEKEKAFEKFLHSYNSLCNLKYHEAAYPLNNMAVCKMFKEEYTNALEYLLEAKYINHSLYSDLAIKVHMMICYRELNEEEKCRKYMQKLGEYLLNHSICDYNIIRKLSVNLCITHLYYGETILAKQYLSKGLPYFTGTISEYRGHKLDNELNDRNHSTEQALRSNDYYTTLKFEPWIITLSHD